ncbi:DNA ligase 4-like [Argiope bruennichi]|uniref:DNA ligase 4-like n=1 Tax=Argiope bruennichi TaxID=94029 RepID=UPI00249473D8|nr:DNA ligase 4-like [Argiope bruennichi]XP_055945642.1 DNA ligase 4-like [Argiope bruennichi]XP_055945643.1 DNA ligase 4-like [Argiope bruennichi]
MSTVAEHVPFLHLCRLCQKISDKKGKDKKVKPLVEFIHYWQDFHKKLHTSNPDTTDSFFPAMRLLLPQCERQRAAYGIKEFTLAKLLIEIFCLDKNSVDAQKLLNYRSPKSANAEAGDFASVAYFVLKNRSPEKGTLTIYDINYYLDSIAANHADKNKDELKHDLLHLLRNTTALEQKWLIRMILKDMKLGISENTILNAFHTDARDLYNVTNSLEKVCCSLKDRSVRLHEIEISLFSPFRPMLAEMALPTQVEGLMKGKPFFIETKYDGERLQLHKDGNSYMYFSRGGFDCTETYGSTPSQGNLTPFIHKSFKPGINKCILDGEIVIYSNKLNCIVSKGENADVQALEPDGDYEPCFCVFDILMLNDKVLSSLPLTERISYIKNTFTAIENKIRYTEQITASTNDEVTEELNKAIDSRLEGIVVKNPDSIYKPNMRKGCGWLKVKPEYIENLMDELDLLIIGGYYGEGRRSTAISHFLLAVASPDQTDGMPNKFYSFSKVGSGYSFKELYELSGKFGDHWQPYNPKKSPSYLVIGGGRKEQPDVWIEPSKSVIVQVKASEIVRSKGFATNCTLRFPRVEKIRYDKPWHDCMTTIELDDLRNLAQGRLATKRSVASEEEPSPKKQKIPKEKAATVAPHFRPTDTSSVQKVSELFKDKEICVIFASLERKQAMEKLIVQHGGKCVQNPGNNTFCVVCDKTTVKVKNIIKTDMYDVVKCEWIDKCIQNQRLLSWIPDDLIHATEKTRDNLGELFDKYGDSFTEDVTEDSLMKIFSNIPKEEWMSVEVSSRQIAEMEKSLFSEQSPYGLFRECWIFIKSKNDDVIPFEDLNEDCKILYFQLKLHGANMCKSTDDRTTHIIIPSCDGMSEKVCESMAQLKKRNIHILTEQWAQDSIKENKLLNEEDYEIKKESVDSSDESLFSF